MVGGQRVNARGEACRHEGRLRGLERSSHKWTGVVRRGRGFRQLGADALESAWRPLYCGGKLTILLPTYQQQSACDRRVASA